MPVRHNGTGWRVHMMKNLNTWGKRMLLLTMAFVLALGGVSVPVRASAAERTPAEYVFTDYDRNYHLASFLNGYNVLAFGNVYLGLHCVGALLVQGDYDGAPGNSGFADGDKLPPSFIKGYYAAPKSQYNSRNNDVEPLYVGSSNTVSTWQDWYTTHYSVNGKDSGNNGTTPVYINDNFFNFKEAHAVVKNAQESMSRNSTIVEPDEDNVITINIGDNVTIRNISNVKHINIVGDASQKVNTTINVEEGGSVNAAKVFFGGKEPAVDEQSGEGTSIVWNFKHATAVVLPTQNWIGHVIAPDADVQQISGNYNGCIICKNLYSYAEGHLYAYTADETSWDVGFTVEKIWVDGDDADGIRPEHIEIQLLADGKPHGKPVRLTAKDGWYHIWKNLPETDAAGKEIVYSVQEVNVPAGYVSVYNPDNQTVVNTHDYETVDISGTKTWLNEWGWSRPWSITVRLYADGHEVANQVVNTSIWGGTNAYSFKGMPKYKDGKEIVYTIHEDPLPGYIGKVEGYDLINTYGVEPVVVSGTKIWDDNNNADGIRPDEVVIQLLANGQVIEEHHAAPNTSWTFTFGNLPSNDEQGNKITYTVQEKNVPEGYTASVDGYDITNTHKPETTSVRGKKTWKDDNDNDGVRPQSITVILLGNMQEIERKTVTAADNWEWEFKDLPKNAGGSPISYTVQEESVNGYTSHADGMNLTNTHEKETTEVSGRKSWFDDNNAAGARPASITIRVWDGAKEVASKVVTEADGWAWNFTGLQKFRNGEEIKYTITEDPVPGYETKVSGYYVDNEYTVEAVEVSGKKTWNDSNNQDGKRPTSITINLLADGQEVDSKTVTAADNWSWQFTNLPKSNGTTDIVYTITEDAVKDYTTVVSGYNVANTYETESTSVSGSKTWNDSNNQDGKRPSSITINLLAGGQKIDSKTVTEADGWSWSFTDLPKYADGKEIVYTITEDAVADYTTVVSGYNVANTYETETTSVSGSKTWNDANNQDGKRPTSITINLFADGQEIDSKTVTEADKWSWSFTDLPKYADGKEIVYTITEDAVADYTTVVSGYNVANTYATETTSVSGSKTWNDANNQDGKRPTSIKINLFADGQEIDSKTVTEADGWAWSFTDLPKYADGEEIVYTITEDAVKDYTTVVSGYNVTNTYETETTSVSGAKTWNDANNQDGKRPASITINLFADGEKVDSKTVTEADKWSWSFTDLPKYADGKEIVYTITEDAVADYTTVVSGYNVTNTYETETTSVSGSKTWNDANNQDGKRPSSITINLLAGGQKIDSKTVTEADKWSWSFTDLPKYADGKEIVYTITEDTVKDYTTVVSGYNVTNTYETETTSVSGSKTWNDANNQDGKRPTSITINLFADGQKVDSKTVTEADKWSWNFTDLPKYADGKEIVYTITEDAVADYTTVVSGYNVTNTYETETTSVSGSKTWNDANNQDGKRPASITINLFADGEKVDSKTVTEADKWSWSVTDLPKYADGKEIVYTITEDAVKDYTTVVSGYNVTNTYETESTSVSGSKTWNDANNQDGKRPASITINLFADGTKVNSKTVTEADKWSWSFTDLPKYADGKEIVYTITEDAVKDYTTVVSGYNVTNTYETETTSVSGSKTWNDSNNQDGKRPSSITINLLAGGQKIDSKTVTEADKWSWSFTDLPKYADGKEIVYTITEDAVADYTTVVSGYNVTNTYETETTSVSGSKTWNDANNQDGKRPTSIKINLLADGQEIDRKTVTEADGWSWSFTDLPKYADGTEIVYTITEDTVADYTTVVTGYNVANTYETETTSVSGSKTWNDANNQDGKRPTSITINLLADGQEIDSKIVTEADGWSWSFTNLPKYADGTEIVYTITEDTVADYTTVVSGYNVANTYETETTSVSGSKTWKDGNDQDGVRPASITIRLWHGVTEIASKTVTAADNWAWSFTDLPKYAGGKEIKYTITEDPVPEYTTMVVDHDVINTHETEKTSISGRKLWFDDDDVRGLRPESITIRLLANGREVRSLKVTAADNWMWRFTDLPMNENGKPIKYTITEDVVPDYTTRVVGYNVYNTYDRTSFSVTKVWEGREGGQIKLTVYADGKKMNPQPAFTRYGDMYVWEDLLLYNEDGDEIVYSVTEEYMDGYMTIYENVGEYAGETDRVYDGGTIINRGVVNIFVRKVWEGYEEDEEKPEIELVLYCNGVATDVPMPEPDKYGWYKYYNLPAQVDGEDARYTVRETKRIGFMAVYTSADGEDATEGLDGGTITNLKMPATGDNTPLLLWTVLMAAAGAGLVLISRRRRA